ncbi:hypothetical protein HK105_207756 [Polyrhizophydium stewartii]|uniref:Uncharacterized protein n=1 Tax=Polyrhizophydium stewartii TaxID=2732419 RepID=A0ABR4MZV6_9FUNG
MKPFRSLEPSERRPASAASAAGDTFLVASRSPQLMVFDRDGARIADSPKGDPYLRDLRKTKGHVAALTCARWMPAAKAVCASASLDSTVRIWDVAASVKLRDVVPVKSSLPGGRTNVTAMTFSPDAKLLACAGSDGALRLWPASGPFALPSLALEGAHMQNSPVSSLAFSLNNVHLVSRSMDGTLKLWDVRSFRKPLAVADALPSFFEETNAFFSPNDRYILTGTSAKRADEHGAVVVLDRLSLERVHEIPVAGSVVRVLWSGKLNQIFAGTSSGAIDVFYDPVMSLGGIKAPLAKKPKKLAVDDYDMFIAREVPVGPIFTPGAHRRDEKPRSKRKVQLEQANKLKPETPDTLVGKGKGGRIGTNLTQYLMKDIIKDTRRQEDPREAILKYADAAAADPYWIAPAYKDNQPVPVLSESVYQDEFEQELAERKKRRQ